MQVRLFVSVILFTALTSHLARAQEKSATESTKTESDAVKKEGSSNAPPPPIDGAAQLLERLKPDQLKSLANMIEQDWTDRPEWAEMALAVMRDEAMQPGSGWWRSTE